MNLRGLNEYGIQQFTEYLALLRDNPTAPIPKELYDDPRYTTLIEPSVEIEADSFATKFDAAKYFHGRLQSVRQSQLRSNVGLWAWLALYLFDLLCPPDGQGRRKPKENAKYIPRAGDHRFGLDKHQMFFPWKMYSLHGDAARFFLSDPVGKDTRAQREWTGYYLNLSTPLVALAGRLYGDSDTGGLKRGATSNNRKGNLRRFVQIAKQLEVTYDISGMTVEQLLGILPAGEFGKWIEQ